MPIPSGARETAMLRRAMMPAFARIFTIEASEERCDR
jgi:hypothetical protein